jgi:hypothetical protein
MRTLSLKNSDGNRRTEQNRITMDKKELELIVRESEGSVCLKNLKLSTVLRKIVSPVETQTGN